VPKIWPSSGPLGEAEVHDARRAVRTDPDVGRLDIPVHDPLLVGVLQGLGDVGDPLRCLTRRGASPGQQVRQSQPFDEVADQVRPAVLLADFVDRDNRRMPQLRYAPGLAREPVQLLSWTRKTASPLTGRLCFLD